MAETDARFLAEGFIRSCGTSATFAVLVRLAADLDDCFDDLGLGADAHVVEARGLVVGVCGTEAVVSYFAVAPDHSLVNGCSAAASNEGGKERD